MTFNHEKRLWTSWNGNKRHQFDRVVSPGSEAELAETVAAAAGVRPVGTGKSSADICAGTATLLDMRGYTGIESVDEESRAITVRSGTRLMDLIKTVEARGWEIPCLPDIDNITVGGALATGTHGTNGLPLSGYVRSLRLVGADGQIAQVEEGDAGMGAARLSLGTLGVISNATFACRPLRRFIITEAPYADEEWIDRYPHWLETHDFVRILWLPHTNYGYVILGDAVDEAPSAPLRDEPRWHRYRRLVSHILYGVSSSVPALVPVANRVLKSMFFSSRIQRYGTLYGATVTKSRGSTLELAEWSCARDRFPQVFRELKAVLRRFGNGAWAHIPMDVRFVDEDDAWLSCSHGGPAVTMGCVTRHPASADRYRAFDAIESAFLAAQGRPHWAKHYRARASQLSTLWPRWGDFLQERTRRDPRGKFLNGYLRDVLGVGE